MVLFLVVMSVALLAVTKRVSDEELARDTRNEEIAALLKKVEIAATDRALFHGVRVVGQSVDFGSRALFDSGSHEISTETASLLRTFVPEILEIANDPLGQKWFKRIVVEGFTDRTGTYLLNLNLSLQRSQSVLCILLAPPDESGSETELTEFQKEQIRSLFLVGGYSSNSAKETLDESRRIELRLEFRDIPNNGGNDEFQSNLDIGICAL